MAKLFVCDNCEKQFKQALDEVLWVDGGTQKVVDLCAPCRADMKGDVEKYAKDKLKALDKKPKKK